MDESYDSADEFFAATRVELDLDDLSSIASNDDEDTLDPRPINLRHIPLSIFPFPDEKKGHRDLAHKELLAALPRPPPKTNVKAYFAALPVLPAAFRHDPRRFYRLLPPLPPHKTHEAAAFFRPFSIPPHASHSVAAILEHIRLCKAAAALLPGLVPGRAGKNTSSPFTSATPLPGPVPGRAGKNTSSPFTSATPLPGPVLGRAGMLKLDKKADLFPMSVNEKNGTWRQQPGLLSQQEVRLYQHHTINLKSTAPSCEQANFILRQGLAILVAIDFETLCRFKIYKDERTGKTYRYYPYTEAGISELDTRKTKAGIHVQGRDDAWAFPPCRGEYGDRGQKIMSLIRSHHFVVQEYNDHDGLSCHMPHHRDRANPGGFAYGKSRYLREDVLKTRLDSFMNNLRKANRTPFEKRSNKLRPVVLVTWASRCEEETLQRMGLDWFNDEGVTSLDLQQHPHLRAWAITHGLNPVLKAETACAALGVVIDTKRSRRGGSSSLAHNAGNDAAHTLQKFLVMACLSDDQKRKVSNGEYLPRMLPRWNYSALEEANPDPKTGRPRPHGTDFNRVNIRREVKEELFTELFRPDISKHAVSELCPVAPVTTGTVPNITQDQQPRRRQLRPVAPVATGATQKFTSPVVQHVEFRLPLCTDSTRYDFVRLEHRGRWDDQEQWIRMSSTEWEVAVADNARLRAWRRLYEQEETRMSKIQIATDSDDEEEDDYDLPQISYHV